MEVMKMLFNEIYSSYYNTVAAIISMAVEKQLDDKALYKIVREKAFSESIATIPDALKSGEWPFITNSNDTVLKNKPEMPVTELEKRWLKTILNDRRIKLFAQDVEGLKDVQPLYDADDMVYFDRYGDGDDFEDENYINNFRTVLSAIKEKCRLRIVFHTQRGEERIWECVPDKLEYSSKDDKFRLIAAVNDMISAINMARIVSAQKLEPYEEYSMPERKTKELKLMLTDQRNSLERAMLHFSHFEKETKKLDKTHYNIKLHYMAEDESELIIRVLSFGPAIKVTAPDDFVQKIKERIKNQKKI